MKTIPFDISYMPQIESGEVKVVTRDGRSARIICWDRRDNWYPIIGLIYNPSENEEQYLSYTNTGHLCYNETGGPDLMLQVPDVMEDLAEKWIVGYVFNHDDVDSIHAELPDGHNFNHGEKVRVFVKKWEE